MGEIKDVDILKFNENGFKFIAYKPNRERSEEKIIGMIIGFLGYGYTSEKERDENSLEIGPEEIISLPNGLSSYTGVLNSVIKISKRRLLSFESSSEYYYKEPEEERAEDIIEIGKNGPIVRFKEITEEI